MTYTLDRNLQIIYRDLQKDFDDLSDEIQFLKHSKRTDDLRPQERFRLEKQIEEAETKRKQIIQQLRLKELENPSIAMYRTLLRLGYRQQVRLFRRLIEAESVAAFLIHGYPDYGQRWLLNRLVFQYVPYLLTGKLITVNVGRTVRRNDVSALWREVARKVGLRGKQYIPEEIAEQVCQCLHTQNILLVFHEVATMPENTLCELIHDFWLPLVSKFQEQPCQASKFKLLMFLIDYVGCVGGWQVPFIEKLNSHWNHQTPLKSPMITKFSEDDLLDWIETEYDMLPSLHNDKIDNMVRAILANSDNGIPKLALEEICELCGCEWDKESKKWLKL